jgi:type III secretion protein D
VVEAIGAWALVVTTGLHSGARIALLPGSVTVLGSAADSDVVLADDGVASRHMALRLDADETLRLRVFDGAAQLDGAVLAPLAWHAVRPDAVVTLDGSGVTLTLTAAQAACAGSAEPVADTTAPIVATAQRAPRHWWFGVGAATLAVGATLAFVALPRAHEAPSAAGLQALLHDVPSTAAVRVDDAGGALRLHGVADAATQQRLRQALQDKQWSVPLQVATPAQLTAAADELLHARGITAARVTHLGGGRLQVSNADPADAAVQRAADDLRRDLPALAELRFAPYEKPKAPRPPVTDPGQRLAAIVHGPTSYVATADGQRYGIGAVLPDGHAVRAITEQGVQVERDGQSTWLNF